MRFIQPDMSFDWVGLGWVRLGLCSELVVVPLIAREKGVGSCALIPCRRS